MVNYSNCYHLLMNFGEFGYFDMKIHLRSHLMIKDNNEIQHGGLYRLEEFIISTYPFDL